ncbi:MAG TPA: alpha/beta hydrolase [Anaerolineales bacterium]|nr:alpha/beta hydrolase [Anaerolineales bacterium]
MKKVTSNDGTEIAYDKNGTGPAVILVDGALCYRSFGPMSKLSELLAPHFTVYNYDRRGRGDSSDTRPYAVTREIEDMEALINEAGGSAFVFGTSSGACLALEAASKLGDKIKKLALYEAPYTSDKAMTQAWKEYRKQLTELLNANCPGDAVVLFMKSVGTPDEQIEGMRHAPIWPLFEAVGPTLAYDAAILGEDRSVPVKRAAKVTAPALVMNGTAIPFMLDTAKTIANAMPHAQHRTLDGQTHDVNLEVLAPVLVEFFAEKDR